MCMCARWFKKTNNACFASFYSTERQYLGLFHRRYQRGVFEEVFQFQYAPTQERSKKGIKIENCEQHKDGHNKLKPETSNQVSNVIIGYGEKPEDTSLTSTLRLSLSQICN